MPEREREERERERERESGRDVRTRIGQYVYLLAPCAYVQVQ